MKGIELEVFVYDEIQADAAEIVDISLDQCETKPMTFYNIACVGVYDEDGVDYSIIHTNGISFICDKSYQKVIKLIADNK